jgi:hypothetical protein
VRSVSSQSDNSYDVNGPLLRCIAQRGYITSAKPSWVEQPLWRCGTCCIVLWHSSGVHSLWHALEILAVCPLWIFFRVYMEDRGSPHRSPEASGSVFDC